MAALPPKCPPKSPREGFDQTPLTVTRNRSFGTAGNVPASKVVNFTNCRCHAEFFHLKDTPTVHNFNYILRPDRRTTRFFDTSRTIRPYPTAAYTA
ncbi:hypothetical protein CCMA1212_005819 [Trichoderma ghanense]|uniref:Uncharacterized protein n=1 Tax=Trichoderma ghanense TaxID=65468 RepID=A0ABY2H3W1_9HYPO